jgi:hypothetical protein
MGCSSSKHEPAQAPSRVVGGQALYQPLNSARREIRLLMLPYSEVNYDAPIRCSLVPVFLDDEPQYEALSYVW